MTALDSSSAIPGYFDSPWPCEDGGPRRQMIPRGAELKLRSGSNLCATSRSQVMCNMVVLRAPGEVFLQGSTGPTEDSSGWIERIDPISLRPLVRSPDLEAGRVWWAGGVAAHANGSLYVWQGRWVHKLDCDCRPIASRELPYDTPYNSMLVLSDGNLVIKNLVRDRSQRSHFSVLEPERLELIGPPVEIPEASVARIAKDIVPQGEFIYVLGIDTALRYRYAGGRLDRDEEWKARYRILPDGQQSFAWDPIVSGGSIWFLDDGDNKGFRGTFANCGLDEATPLRLARVNTGDSNDFEQFQPFAAPHATICNPPLFDSKRSIAVAFDTANSLLCGLRHRAPGEFERLWEKPFGAGFHMMLFSDTGELVVNDFYRGEDNLVVLDIVTGVELGRVGTGSPVQSVVFPAPGFARDIYYTSFMTVARIFQE
ncbi:MAG TPA: hypothetical protein VMT58_08495 [Candidatus Binataceae bacterium]|nr:hypothetical protein [Candidatus Binataceae bacterium]